METAMPTVLPPALTDASNAQTTIEWLLALVGLSGLGLGLMALWVWRSVLARLKAVEKKVAVLEREGVDGEQCDKNMGRFVAETRRIAEEDRRDRAEFRTELRRDIQALTERIDKHLEGHDA